MHTHNIYAVGCMSGTSLDGLDLALCKFQKTQDGEWQYEILKAETIAYTFQWKQQLRDAPKMSALELSLLNVRYGEYIGQQVLSFLKDTTVRPEFIASHGHTIFHQPDKKFTLQIGSGASIAATSRITTVCDFRTMDVALGGQGAPLVPIGDALLFSNFDYCLNLGGFANISYNEDGHRIAFDICPVNFVVNRLANKLGKTFDENGALGAAGSVEKEMLDSLNNLPYYKQAHPKSLSQEWVDSYIHSMINRFDSTDKDRLRTWYEHVAMQVARVITKKGARILLTGGGTHNSFLVERIKANHTDCEFVIPQKEIVDYKEAVIFAFLGLLRLQKQVNCLKTVTGASADNMGGVVHEITGG